METLYGNLTLELCPGAFPLSTDSMALAHFIKLSANSQVLDLGSGCATLGLLLCGKDKNCHVTGYELDPDAHETALENIRKNQLTHRLNSICADLRIIPESMQPGQFSCCVSNPPYFPGGPLSKTHPTARREDCCSMEDLFRSAGWALHYGGDFYLVHRPERLAQICACAAQFGMEAKRLQLLRHRQNGPISLILVQCRKGGKPGLIWEENTLYTPEGNPTPFYQSLYHL